MSADAATAAGEMLRVVPAGGDELDRRYGADAWQASELGVAAARGRGAVSFDRIDPPWLRVQHDQLRSPCVQTLLELSRLLPAAGAGSAGHRPGAARALPGMAGTATPG